MNLLQTVTPHAEIDPPRRHFFNKKFGLTLLALVVLGGGAYAGVQWYMNEQYSLEEMNPNLTPTSDPAGWQTYTNLQQGFEFKYPSSMIFKETEDVDGGGVSYFMVNVDTKANLEFTCEACDGPATFFRVTVSKPPKNPVANCSSLPEGQISKVTVGGVTGDKCVGDGLNGPNLLVLLTKDGSTYFQIAADNYTGSQKSTIDETLSMFKFTSQK